MKFAVRTVAAALVAAPLFAQQTPPAPAPPFGETIEVRVINVDVMVTDKSGKPVSGLRKEDFELYENGQKLDITNFAEITGTTQTATLARTPQPGVAAQAAPAPAAPVEGPDVRSRKVVLFLDNSTLTPPSRAKVVAAAKAFIAQTIRPSDQVTVVTWNPGLKVNADFTNDLAAVDKTLDSITSTSAFGGSQARAQASLERELFDIIRDYAELQPKLAKPGSTVEPPPRPPIHLAIDHAAGFALQAQHAQREVAGALKAVISTMRAVEGRKAVVFVSEQLDENPGAPFFEFVDQIKDKFENGGGQDPLGEALHYRDPDLIPSIAALANGSGVTLYPMHAGGAAADVADISAESNGMNFSTSTRRTNVMNSSFPTMQRLAAETGGVALTGTNNFTLGFANVANDLTSYYSLGFRATGARQDAVRPLTVKLKNPRGLIVRSRPQYIEKSVPSEMNDAVSANLFFPIARNDLGVKIATGESQPAPENEVNVPLDIKVPTSTLTLVPDGTDLTGRFSIFIAFVRGNGAVSKVTRHEHQVRFPADSLKRRKELTIKTTLTIDPATDAVSVGVMDDISHATGYSMMKLVIPAAQPAAATTTGASK
jgi:VWFA-related protein